MLTVERAFLLRFEKKNITESLLNNLIMYEVNIFFAVCDGFFYVYLFLGKKRFIE